MPATCTDLTAEQARNTLIGEKNRLQAIITEEISNYPDPWVKLLSPTKMPFPEGLGESQRTPILRYTLPTDLDSDDFARTVSMAGIGSSNAAACALDPKIVQYGYEMRSNCIYEWELRSPNFCIKDLQMRFSRERQLSEIMRGLAEHSRRKWSIWLRKSYTQNIQHVTFNLSYAAAGVFPSAVGSYLSTVFPDRGLSVTDLQYFYDQMKYNNATAGAMMISNGAPKFGLIASDEVIWSLRQSDPKYREDLRYSSMGSGDNAPLLKAMGDMGLEQSIYNFIPITDFFPRRYINSAGVLTQVSSHINVPVEDGVRSVVNPAWQSAEFEEVIFYNSKVMSWLTPITSGVSELGLPPQSYMGDFSPIVPPPGDNCDPTQRNAYLLAQFSAGIQPMFPEYAMTVLVKRTRNGVRGACVDSCEFTPTIQRNQNYSEGGQLIFDCGAGMTAGQIIISTSAAITGSGTLELVFHDGTVVPVVIVTQLTVGTGRQYLLRHNDNVTPLSCDGCGGPRALRYAVALPTPVVLPDDCGCGNASTRCFTFTNPATTAVTAIVSFADGNGHTVSAYNTGQPYATYTALANALNTATATSGLFTATLTGLIYNANIGGGNPSPLVLTQGGTQVYQPALCS